MYKIYINETPLHLTSTAESLSFGVPGDKNLVLRYAGKKKFLLSVIDQLEKTGRFEKVVIFSENLEKLWSDFQSAFKLINAAGGVVFNQQNQALMIFRRGYWDLPKGKIDDRETPSQAALREVQEETGLARLTLGPHLLDTWHTYEQGGKRILKTTHWFLMKTDQLSLIPQQVEDIEQAVWRDIEAFLKQSEKVYGNILDVLSKTKLVMEEGKF